MKNMIYTDASSQTSVANTALNVGDIERRIGCNFYVGSNYILIKKQGYYDVDVIAELTNSSGATVTTNLLVQKNESPLPGATASATIENGNSTTLTIPTVVRTNCCEKTNISVALDTAGVTVTNLAIRITEV